MSAVWSASRAAVRRHRFQTFVTGLVVLFSTAIIVVGLGLLAASSAPFDHAFDQQEGAHVVATFDSAQASAARLARTAHRPGVEAAAGPFEQAVPHVTSGGEPFVTGTITVVGRADPAGSVDRLSLVSGRWAARPGEVVLNSSSIAATRRPVLGEQVRITGGPALRVVGTASSVSGSADAWVSPGQVAALHPTGTQMLYRFATSSTSTEISAHLAAVTAGLPAHSLVASHSYLAVKQAFTAGPGALVPLLMVFGVLGLLVAVLIVGNVISGAVISGLRHIGILKAIGFTPRQVVAVYLLMISVPAAVGCVLGTVVGDLVAAPLLHNAFSGATFDQGSVGVDLGHVGVSPWVLVASLLGMPAVVVLAALVPALRAHRLSAAQAISAGSTPRAGRGPAVQRRLGGTRLPRSVSLGLGLPLARPGRTALTLAALLLGVTTATFATGLAKSATAYGDAVGLSSGLQVTVEPGDSAIGEVTSKLSDPQREALLRSLPGTVHVTSDETLRMSLAGFAQGAYVDFLQGDSSTLGFQRQIVEGRWLKGPGEIVAASDFLHRRDLRVGDRLTLRTATKRAPATIVGEIMHGAPSSLYADRSTLAPLAPEYDVPTFQPQYLVRIASGTDVDRYMAAVRAADPGLHPRSDSGTNNFTAVAITLSWVLTLMLATVAALGVFHTVVLNTRERRREVGMLKSIGMTPRQVVAMVVTSMAELGVVAAVFGVPLGVLAHRLIMPMAAHAAMIDIPGSLLDVWRAPVLASLALAGVVIAVLGALLPARAAARLTIAKVLHNE